MVIKDVLNKYETALSFEFFPPKSEKSSRELFANISELDSLKPAYVSVTYGAGGTTREYTHDLVVKLTKETNISVVAHLTCVGHTKDEIYSILKRYDDEGVSNIMALRGDPPEGGTAFEPTPGGFKYASELVAFIKEKFPHMGVGVAGFPEGHPETPNRLKEMENLKMKVDAGADYICTQLFFDNRYFYDFKERCRLAGIDVPIIAGIMPVTSIKGMQRMADLALGTNFPSKLLKALSRADSKELVEKVGIHWATEQVMDLIDSGAKGIHFYTLNKSEATKNIYETVGIQSSDSLAL